MKMNDDEIGLNFYTMKQEHSEIGNWHGFLLHPLGSVCVPFLSIPNMKGNKPGIGALYANSTLINYSRVLVFLFNNIATFSENKNFPVFQKSQGFKAHVLAHLLKSFKAYNVKSSSTLFSENIQSNFKISFPCVRFNN